METLVEKPEDCGCSLTSKNLVSYGLASPKASRGAVSFVWLMSSTTPQSYNQRGIWTDDGVWGTDEIWYV